MDDLAALQNDFSYYRRHFGKMGQLPGVTVQEAEANLISLFMAKVGLRTTDTAL